MTLGLVGFASCLYGFMWYWLAKKNQRRQDGKENDRVTGMSEDEIAELGDKSPRFVYTI